MKEFLKGLKKKKLPWVYIIAIPSALLGWIVAAVVWVLGRVKPKKRKRKS